ncbi:hypothetical protein MMC26_006881 [Xylographa opegraphella]|nr:hypothetical protein [Xylographa opegraphella]
MRALVPLATLVLTSLLLANAKPIAVPSEIDSSVYDLNDAGEPDWVAIKAYEDSKKYFHEPGSHAPGSDDMLGHYDTRYFGELLSYESKRDTQVHMVRAYLEIFQELGIETWIAHGTLLGWWWNGKACLTEIIITMLPWDWDIDTQISESTLKYLATNLNHTFHTYTAATSAVHNDPVTRTYLLDVNSQWEERERGDGFNIIDARWIDVHSGLYIDITAVSETDPDVLPGLLSCKNLHRYQVKDLYPMRETMYEGVLAKVPYNYDLILVEEYREEALVRTEFEGHVWDASKKEWVKQPESRAES